jgi:hypothetical protein
MAKKVLIEETISKEFLFINIVDTDVDHLLKWEENKKFFEDLVNARIFIKHEEFDKAKELFGGLLAKYLEDETTAAKLSKALKIAINSVYGELGCMVGEDGVPNDEPMKCEEVNSDDKA